MNWKSEKAKYEAEKRNVDKFVEKLIAKKDFEIFHNGYHRKIKAGEDITDVPARYLQNLKTEKVI